MEPELLIEEAKRVAERLAADGKSEDATTVSMLASWAAERLRDDYDRWCESSERD